MSARDELADDLQDVFEGGDLVYEDIASALMLRGYSKPRTITTVEELDALQMAVVRTDAGSIANIVNGRAYFFGYEASVPCATLALPAIVIYSPEES